MEEKYQRLKQLVGEAWDLQVASAIASWDMQVYMPPAGAEERSQVLGTLASLIHDKSTAPEIGELLNDLQPLAAQNPDSLEAGLIKRLQRLYDKETRVPRELVAEFARITGQAYEIWMRARATCDFELFRPYLERIVELRREYANLFAPYDHIYDPLLDDFEPGMKTRDVQEIFTILRQEQVELVKAISQRPQVEDGFLHLEYPEQQQWDFGVEVATRLGFNWKAGRQDRSAHPFTTSFGIDDVRITTRFIPDQMSSALFSTMHEGGHALYQLGLDKALARTPLADGASLAVHESQSRMYENLVGRSRAFWRFFYPRLQEVFPSQLGGVDMETFYRGINKVEPSLIRVEADEATYNLHVMLRLELEIAMLEGRLAIKDLPEAWNERMQEYLGLTPPDVAKGVLQDVHWSGGSLGYFPTYSLGNLVSVQLFERLRQDVPDLDEQMARGEFGALLEWLREHVHKYGARYEPQELVERVTGSKITPHPYLRYLREKYSDIYGL
ncbi:MAG TPA: carboxypeptidase M32 [Anaerolineaceae bacterium]|nr:carboxypeptidase M32 [Anaerolineaceae bacterium]